MKNCNYNLLSISKNLGFSTTTVSQLLNGKGERYSKKTRSRILESASKCGYRPNIAARYLKIKKNYSIGILVHMLFMELDEIENKCSSEGYFYAGFGKFDSKSFLLSMPKWT